MSDRDGQDFAARRAAARAVLDRLDDRGAKDAKRLDWFEAVYELADDDPARVPWADQVVHPLLAQWLARDGKAPLGGKALDVGCGIGDNAEALAGAGYAVTAFDVVERAVAWARRRFPASRVAYLKADLFDPPVAWRQSFDLVNEIYTIQALPLALRARTTEALAALVKPGGRLLLIARQRTSEAPPDGPPWPLSDGELELFERAGLTRTTCEIVVPDDDGRPHWRVVWRR